MTKQAGRFTMTDGMLQGPAEYMQEQGNAKLDRILAGTDAGFNAMQSFQPDTELLILVALQTDYAGWHGMKTFRI